VAGTWPFPCRPTPHLTPNPPQDAQLPGFPPAGKVIYEYLFPFYHIGRAYDLILSETEYVDSDGEATREFDWDRYDRRGRPKNQVRSSQEGARVTKIYPQPVSQCVRMLVVDTFLYLAAAWYVGQVASAGKPWYFLFLPSYWGLPSPWGGGAVRDGDTLEGLRRSSAANGSVVGRKISKVHSGTQALREVSLEMLPGQIWALLGQNGAGKTSLVNCLSGFHDLTYVVARLATKVPPHGRLTAPLPP